jgi:hypothetical protein
MAEASEYPELSKITEEKDIKFYFVSRKLNNVSLPLRGRPYRHWGLLLEIHEKDVRKIGGTGIFIGWWEPKYLEIVCELDSVKEGFALSIVSKAEDIKTGNWENKERIFLGEKRMVPARLAHMLEKHPMNGEKYNVLYNNCQKWLKCFLTDIDISFVENLPKEFEHTAVGHCLEVAVGPCLDAIKASK